MKLLDEMIKVFSKKSGCPNMGVRPYLVGLQLVGSQSVNVFGLRIEQLHHHKNSN